MAVIMMLHLLYLNERNRIQTQCLFAMTHKAFFNSNYLNQYYLQIVMNVSHLYNR